MKENTYLGYYNDSEKEYYNFYSCIFKNNIPIKNFWLKINKEKYPLEENVINIFNICIETIKKEGFNTENIEYHYRKSIHNENLVECTIYNGEKKIIFKSLDKKLKINSSESKKLSYKEFIKLLKKEK